MTKEFFGCMEMLIAAERVGLTLHDLDGLTSLIGGGIRPFDYVLNDFSTYSLQISSLWNKYYNHANEPVHRVPFVIDLENFLIYTQQWRPVYLYSAHIFLIR